MTTIPPAANRPRRKTIIGTVFLLIGTPALLAVIEATNFHVRNRSNGVILSSGQRREYLLHVPSSYDSARPTPLVITMHGGSTWPAQQMHLSGWNRVAEENGFIVVYPSGSETPRRWHTFQPEDGLERDVRFLSELIDTLQSRYDIDPERIYANGMSNGGGMAFVLSCALSNRIAAVAMVAPAQSLPPSWCSNTRPVPTMVVQGDADPMVPYEGGPLGDPFSPVKPVFPAVRDFVASLAQRNRCAASPVESMIAPDVVRTEYPNCVEGAAVVLYTLVGGGHTWPGGEPLPKWFVGPTSNSIDATIEMWAFFRTHRLRGVEAAAQQR